MEKIVREFLFEGFREKASKALSQTKADPELEIYNYFEDRGDMNMLRALRSILKRLLGNMDFDMAFEIGCDINGVTSPEDQEELRDTLTKMFDMPGEEKPSPSDLPF